MSKIINKQYVNKVQQFASLKGAQRPPEGWVRTMRKALGMSSPQLANRLTISKAQASQIERMEVEDRITLKQLRRVAEALGCDLVYVFVPHQPVDEMVRAQAMKKAKQLVMQAHAHMVLEAQQLDDQTLQDEIASQAEQFMRDKPRSLWEP